MDVIVTDKNPKMTEQAYASLIEEFGSLEGFVTATRAYRELCARMRSEKSALKEQYPNKWVGMAFGDVLVVGDSLEEALELLEEQGANCGRSVVEFLNTKPTRMIL